MAVGHGTWAGVGGGVVALGAFPGGFGAYEVVGSHTSPWDNAWFLLGAAMWALGALILVGTVCHFVWDWWRRRDGPPRPPVPQSPQAHPTSEPGRIFIKTSIRKLTRIVRRNTAPQSKAMLQPYIGKWMTVSGRLAEVSPHWHPDWSPWFSVQLKVTPFQRYEITLNFEGEWGEYLESLRKGTRMVVNGQIVTVQRRGVWLGDCEPSTGTANGDIEPLPPKRQATTGIRQSGGTSEHDDPAISGVDTAIDQTGGHMKTRGLMVDGQNVSDEQEEEGGEEAHEGGPLHPT